MHMRFKKKELSDQVMMFFQVSSHSYWSHQTKVILTRLTFRSFTPFFKLFLIHLKFMVRMSKHPLCPPSWVQKPLLIRTGGLGCPVIMTLTVVVPTRKLAVESKVGSGDDHKSGAEGAEDHLREDLEGGSIEVLDAAAQGFLSFQLYVLAHGCRFFSSVLRPYLAYNIGSNL